MRDINRLHDAIVEAGIPITGLSADPLGRVTLAPDNPPLTAEQLRQVGTIIDAWDRTPPKPVRPRAAIRSAVEGLTATERNKLRDALAVEQLLDLAETDPDRVQALAARLNLTLPIRET